MHPLLSQPGVLLHVGCGPKSIAHTPFAGSAWQEIRLDIDPSAAADLTTSMLHIEGLADGAVDAVFSSHNLEHLEAHQVPRALAEFHRVLKPTGFCLITCPDLQAIGAALSSDRLVEPLFQSGAGAITPLDILYGHRPSLAAGHQHMAHRCGFTGSVLRQLLEASGFRHVGVSRRAAHFDLWALAGREAFPPEQLEPLARSLFFRSAGVR